MPDKSIPREHIRISQPPDMRQIGSGATIQDNHKVLTHAKILAPQIPGGGKGLLAIVFAVCSRREPIVARTLLIPLRLKSTELDGLYSTTEMGVKAPY